MGELLSEFIVASEQLIYQAEDQLQKIRAGATSSIGVADAFGGIESAQGILCVSCQRPVREGR